MSEKPIYVLGCVVRPGPVRLPRGGSLIAALSQVGGIPMADGSYRSARCTIVRVLGEAEIVEVDLDPILLGGKTGNAPALRAGDVIYVPDPNERGACVMGEVARPRVIRVSEDTTLRSAIREAGGLTDYAAEGEIYILSRKGGTIRSRRFDLTRMRMIDADEPLANEDLVYVARTGQGDVTFALRWAADGSIAIEGDAGEDRGAE